MLCKLCKQTATGGLLAYRVMGWVQLEAIEMAQGRTSLCPTKIANRE